MALITIAEARTSFENWIDDNAPEVSDALFIEWSNWIDDRIYQELARLDPEQYISEQTISIVSGTSSYSVNSDFKNVDSVGSGLYKVDSSSNLTDFALPKTKPGSSQLGFYIKGNVTKLLIITPEPQASTTYILRYIPKRTRHTATTDSMILDDEFTEALAFAFVALYRSWNASTDAPFADQNFVRALDNLLDNFRNEAYTFDMGNISYSYR